MTSNTSDTANAAENPIRIGVDLGGTKIEAVALAADGTSAWRERVPTPKASADDIYDAITGLVTRCETTLNATASVGIGTPGSLSPKTGLLRGSNTVVLNGQPVKQALEARLKREVRMANDANCFALSEAVDGAGKGAASVFGVILGTGVGGGIVINGQIVNGLHAIAVNGATTLCHGQRRTSCRGRAVIAENTAASRRGYRGRESPRTLRGAARPPLKSCNGRQRATPWPKRICSA